MIDARINYKDFSIVGQGYSWISMDDNLTIDSWQNLRPEIDDTTIVPILKAFARRVVAENKNIYRVTIGVGDWAGTPEIFKENMLAFGEIISAGQQDEDTSEQALLYADPVKLQYLFETFELTLEKQFHQLNKSIWKNQQALKDFIAQLNLASTMNSSRLLERIVDLFLNDAMHEFWMFDDDGETNLSHFEKFCLTSDANTIILMITALALLKSKRLLNSNILKYLLYSYDAEFNLSDFILLISKLKNIDEIYFEKLIEFVCRSKDSIECCYQLFELNSLHLLSEINITLLTSRHWRSSELGKLIDLLHLLKKSNVELSIRTCQLFLTEKLQLKPIISILRLLQRYHLLNQGNVELLFDHDDVCNIFKILAHSDLIGQFISKRAYPNNELPDCGKLILQECLNQIRSGTFTIENQKVLALKHSAELDSYKVTLEEFKSSVMHLFFNLNHEKVTQLNNAAFKSDEDNNLSRSSPRK